MGRKRAHRRRHHPPAPGWQQPRLFGVLVLHRHADTEHLTILFCLANGHCQGVGSHTQEPGQERPLIVVRL